MKTLSLLLVVPFAVMVSGCGSDSASGTPTPPNISGALAEYLPKSEATTALMMQGGLRTLGDISTLGAGHSCSTNYDAYSTQVEPFTSAVEEGCGLIGRTMGTSDPLSIWSAIDMVEMVGQAIKDGKITVTDGSKTITLPFGIGETAASATVTHTFGVAKYEVSKDMGGGQVFYVTLTDLKGGYTDTIFGVAFKAQVYADAGRTTQIMNNRFLFYGQLPSADKGFVLRVSRHEYEGTAATADRTSRAIFMFDATSDSTNYRYKALSEYKWLTAANGGTNPDTNEVWLRVGINMTGTKLDKTLKTGKFIVRKHSMHCTVASAACSGIESVSDQWFAVNYDGTKTGAARFGGTSAAATGQAANYSSDALPGLGGTDLTGYGDLNYVKASNMYDVTSNTVVNSALPSSQTALTPTNW